MFLLGCIYHTLRSITYLLKAQTLIILDTYTEDVPVSTFTITQLLGNVIVNVVFNCQTSHPVRHPGNFENLGAEIKV